MLRFGFAAFQFKDMVFAPPVCVHHINAGAGVPDRDLGADGILRADFPQFSHPLFAEFALRFGHRGFGRRELAQLFKDALPLVPGNVRAGFVVEGGQDPTRQSRDPQFPAKQVVAVVALERVALRVLPDLRKLGLRNDAAAQADVDALCRAVALVMGADVKPNVVPGKPPLAEVAVQDPVAIGQGDHLPTEVDVKMPFFRLMDRNFDGRDIDIAGADAQQDFDVGVHGRQVLLEKAAVGNAEMLQQPFPEARQRYGAAAAVGQRAGIGQRHRHGDHGGGVFARQGDARGQAGRFFFTGNHLRAKRAAHLVVRAVCRPPGGETPAVGACAEHGQRIFEPIPVFVERVVGGRRRPQLQRLTQFGKAHSDAPVGDGKGDGVGVGWAFGEYDRHKPLLLFGVGCDGIVHQFAQSLDAGHILMGKAREGAFVDPDVDGVGMDRDFWIHGGPPVQSMFV